MTPEREDEIRRECGNEWSEQCKCHNDKDDLLEEVDRLRSLLATANHTIYALAETVRHSTRDITGEVPQYALDWFKTIKDEKFLDYER